MIVTPSWHRLRVGNFEIIVVDRRHLEVEAFTYYRLNIDIVFVSEDLSEETEEE